MNTSRSLTPKAWAKLTNRSWVIGRGGVTLSILMAIDWASAGPITTGMRPGPSASASISAYAPFCSWLYDSPSTLSRISSDMAV